MVALYGYILYEPIIYLHYHEKNSLRFKFRCTMEIVVCNFEQVHKMNDSIS